MNINQDEMQRCLAAVCQENGLRTDGEVNDLLERISFALKSRKITIQALELEVKIADAREERANEIIRKAEADVADESVRKVKRMLGPDTHVCFTPDNTPRDQRVQVSLVAEADLLKIERAVEKYISLLAHVDATGKITAGTLLSNQIKRAIGKQCP